MNKNEKVRLSTAALIVIIASMIGVAGAAIQERWIEATPEFNIEVHSYVDQAYWVNDPAYIKQNLTLAVEGMRGLGLTNDMSWKFWSWEQVPSESMTAQYGQMQSIINQCDQAIAMNKSSYSYQPLITQIHQTICTPQTSDGGGGNWCDEVAYGAYLLNFHPFAAWQAWVIAGVLLILLLATAFVRVVEESRR